MEINNIAAIVTGGSSGLGGATARALAAAGAKVTIFDINAEAGAAAAREIGGHFAAVDVTDDQAVTTAVADAEAKHGIARILVNCAGIAPGARVVGKDGTPHSIELFRKTIGINLLGSFNMIAKVSARMIAADPIGEERGVLISTASVAAYDGQVGQAAYSASKGGVVGMTLPIARDLAQHKIRVMGIAPGVFMTPMVAGFTQEVQDSLGSQVPHPSRLGRPEEYAQLALAIIANPMLNGEVIRLDGAIRMAPR